MATEWELVWKRMKVFVFVRAAALYPFPAWQRFLASVLRVKSHFTSQSRTEKGQRHRECSWPSLVSGTLKTWTLSWTIIQLCVYFLCVKMDIWISFIPPVGWVCNRTLQVCYLSMTVHVCVFEWKKPRKQLYLCACVCVFVSAISDQLYHHTICLGLFARSWH